MFDRIDRNRIAQLTTVSNQLTLALACDCIAAAFVVEGPYLVIDVAQQAEVLSGNLISKEEPAEEKLAVAPLIASRAPCDTAIAGNATQRRANGHLSTAGNGTCCAEPRRTANTR